jgi:NADH dehydrogenase
MILVVGASGSLGRETSRQLLAAGQPVRALTRTPAHLAALQQAGAEVVTGDLTDPPSLARACQGAQAVIAAAHALAGNSRNASEQVDDLGHRALIDAAQAAGVAHFVFISVMGAAPDHPIDFYRTKFAIETYLKASGLAYTILRPSAFMELHAHTFNGAGILQNGQTRQLGPGTKRRNFVAVRDVARLAVRALTDPALRGRTLDVGGPGNYTNNEVTALYGRLAGVTPKINRLPRGVARVLSLVLRPFQPGLSRILHIGSLPDDAFTETFAGAAALEQEFGLKLLTLEEFVQARVAEAKAQAK